MWNQLISSVGKYAQNLFKGKPEPAPVGNGSTDPKLTFGQKANKFLNSDPFKEGIGNLAMGAGDLMSAQSSSLPTSVKQMQTGDSVTNMAADAASMIPGVGSAIGLGIKLVNGIGSSFVKTPTAFKNFTQNQNIMASSSLGGVAANAQDVNNMITGFKGSGLVGKLIGKKSKNVNKAVNSMDMQAKGQNLLTQNNKAFEQTASANMFDTQNNMVLNGYDTNKLRFGKNGMKIEKQLLQEVKEIAKMQAGSKIPVLTSGLKMLNSGERSAWNSFANYVDNQGYSDSDDVNDLTFTKQLFEDFNKHTGNNYNYDEFIPAAKFTMKRYRDHAMSKLKQGFGKLDNYTKEDISNADFDWDNLFLPSIAKIEGVAMKDQLSFRFPNKRGSSENNKEVQTQDQNQDKEHVAGPINNNEPDPEIVQGIIDEKRGVDEENKKKSFKKGGVIDGDNVIVDGALHARKHFLKEVEHLQDAEITQKGVPVVSMGDGGEIVQHAEVEKNEVIFCIETTKKLEALMKDGSDEAKIEAGKLLTKELLHNTKDSSSKLLD